MRPPHGTNKRPEGSTHGFLEKERNTTARAIFLLKGVAAAISGYSSALQPAPLAPARIGQGCRPGVFAIHRPEHAMCALVSIQRLPPEQGDRTCVSLPIFCKHLLAADHVEIYMAGELMVEHRVQNTQWREELSTP